MARDTAARPTHSISTTRAYIQLLITITVWGGYFVVAKRAVDEASPMALAAGRYLIGGAVLGVMAMRLGPWPRPDRRELGILAVMGLTSVFGFNVLAFMGLELAPASDAALVMPTVPSLFVIPLAAWLLGERVGRWQVAGLGLLLLGEFIVFRRALFAEGLGGERLAGIGLFVATAFLWAIYTLCTRLLGGRIGPVHATLYSVVIGLALLIPVGAWPLAEELTGGASPGLWGALIYLGVLQTVLGLVWWFEGVQAIGASKAAVLNTLVPIVALFLAAVFLDEVPGLERVAGAGIVIAGVAVAASLPLGGMAGRRGATAAAATADVD